MNIEQLTADLSPSPKRLAPSIAMLLWLGGSMLWAWGVSLWLGPLRANVTAQMLSQPMYMIELATGLAAICVLFWAAMCHAMPGYPARQATRIGMALAILWVGSILWGFLEPAGTHSMLGKRHHCMWEVFLISTPPILSGVILQIRRYALQPVQAAWVAGLAAGLIPAWIMQVACMHEPEHALRLHIAPALAMGILAALVVARMVHSGYFSSDNAA